MKQHIILLTFFVFLISCNTDDEAPASTPEATIPAGSGVVLLANEGGFNQGTASLTVFDPATEVVVQNVFSARNSEAPLGDILQSITKYRDALYLVVNNSQKIEVLNAANYTRISTIEGLTSPRYMHIVDSTKALVTDLFAGGIHKIDPLTGNYTGMIPTSEWLERLLEVGDEIWASAPGGNQIFMLDPISDEITGSIALTAGPNDMVRDVNGKVWVLCQGDFDAVFPALYRIDVATHAVDVTIALGNTLGYGGSLAISPSGDQLYLLIGGAVYSMSISENTLPNTPFILAESRNLYGLSVNPYTGHICVTDAVDFSSNGEAFIYSEVGDELHRFSTGIAPRFVHWTE